MAAHEINWHLIQNVVLIILYDFYLKASSEVAKETEKQTDGCEAWHLSCS
jgi:hypothetical protein